MGSLQNRSRRRARLVFWMKLKRCATWGSRAEGRSRMRSGSQRRDIELSNGQFAKQVAPARTFGFLDEVEALRNLGLARGGSLENAIWLATPRHRAEQWAVCKTGRAGAHVWFSG